MLTAAAEALLAAPEAELKQPADLNGEPMLAQNPDDGCLGLRLLHVLQQDTHQHEGACIPTATDQAMPCNWREDSWLVSDPISGPCRNRRSSCLPSPA